jgi:hypothetical protein
MAQHTAVDYLIQKLSLVENTNQFTKNIIDKAKEMEKQQHGATWDAAIKAHDNRGHVHARSIVDFDDYYNETYKK